VKYNYLNILSRTVLTIVLVTRVKILDETNIYVKLKAEIWPASIVGIATGYGMDGPGIESR